MNEGINLLPLVEEKRKENPKNVLIMRGIGIGCVIIVFLLEIVIFYLNATSPLPSLTSQQSSLISDLTAVNTKFIKYTLLTKRTDDINNILTTRSQYDVLMEHLYSAAPSDISISGLTLSGKTISFSISSPSLASYNTFFDTLVTMAQKKDTFSSVQAQGITFSPTSNTYGTTIAAIGI